MSTTFNLFSKAAPVVEASLDIAAKFLKDNKIKAPGRTLYQTLFTKNEEKFAEFLEANKFREVKLTPIAQIKKFENFHQEMLDRLNKADPKAAAVQGPKPQEKPKVSKDDAASKGAIKEAPKNKNVYNLRGDIRDEEHNFCLYRTPTSDREIVKLIGATGQLTYEDPNVEIPEALDGKSDATKLIKAMGYDKNPNMGEYPDTIFVVHNKRSGLPQPVGGTNSDSEKIYDLIDNEEVVEKKCTNNGVITGLIFKGDNAYLNKAVTEAHCKFAMKFEARDGERATQRSNDAARKEHQEHKASSTIAPLKRIDEVGQEYDEDRAVEMLNLEAEQEKAMGARKATIKYILEKIIADIFSKGKLPNQMSKEDVEKINHHISLLAKAGALYFQHRFLPLIENKQYKKDLNGNIVRKSIAILRGVGVELVRAALGKGDMKKCDDIFMVLKKHWPSHNAALQDFAVIINYALIGVNFNTMLLNQENVDGYLDTLEANTMDYFRVGPASLEAIHQLEIIIGAGCCALHATPAGNVGFSGGDEQEQKIFAHQFSALFHFSSATLEGEQMKDAAIGHLINKAFDIKSEDVHSSASYLYEKALEIYAAAIPKERPSWADFVNVLPRRWRSQSTGQQATMMMAATAPPPAASTKQQKPAVINDGKAATRSDSQHNHGDGGRGGGRGGRGGRKHVPLSVLKKALAEVNSTKNFGSPGFGRGSKSFGFPAGRGGHGRGGGRGGYSRSFDDDDEEVEKPKNKKNFKQIERRRKFLATKEAGQRRTRSNGVQDGEEGDDE